MDEILIGFCATFAALARDRDNVQPEESMPRYVLVNRRAGKYTAEAKRASRAQVATVIARLDRSAKIVADRNPKDELARRVVILDSDASAIEKVQGSLHPDAVLEPLIRRPLHRRLPAGFVHAMPTTASASVKPSTPYRVMITAGGHVLEGIQVTFYYRGASGHSHQLNVVTNKDGVAGMEVPDGFHVSVVQPFPNSGFWTMLADAPRSGSSIDCLRLAEAGAGGEGWWHKEMGIDVHDLRRGSGIKVGVIDTGCGPHPNLAHVKLAGVFVDGGSLPADQATDVSQHGTHTTGIIGARPTRNGNYAGMAADCDLFHVRVYKSEDEPPSTADLINAIDSLSRDHGCDLINMSLGGGSPSEGEEDCIRDAVERGTLCICSAGNETGQIDFPASYDECAAVSAIGLTGWAPTGTFSASHRPEDSTKMGKKNLFLAAFSNFGHSLMCAGPGVGIISTVPSKGGGDSYMEMDGTSMSSPAVCGVLAAILSKDHKYKALARDVSRTSAARKLLAEHSVTFGLPVKFEGRGLPAL